MNGYHSSCTWKPTLAQDKVTQNQLQTEDLAGTFELDIIKKFPRILLVVCEFVNQGIAKCFNLSNLRYQSIALKFSNNVLSLIWKKCLDMSCNIK